METGHGEFQCMGSDSSVCKLTAAKELWIYERSISFLHIYRKNIYAKGDVFLRQKIGILLIILLLIGAVAGSQKVGEHLYQNISEDETAQTAAQGTNTVKEENEKPVIVLDSGHGGSDPGKVGINKALEKDVNLEVAQKVKEFLEAKGITVVMTRTDANGLAGTKVEDMKTRVNIINREKPVLAVSIHQNSYQEESIHGAQVFYYTHSQEGEKAAKVMQEALRVVDPENKRQAKANDTYYMLKKTEIPVIIVECGFLSNMEEAEKLITEEYQQQMAKAVGAGVVEYLEKVQQ